VFSSLYRKYYGTEIHAHFLTLSSFILGVIRHLGFPLALLLSSTSPIWKFTFVSQHLLSGFTFALASGKTGHSWFGLDGRNIE
jgi:hypothetical protein